jgi:hypothetical protein
MLEKIIAEAASVTILDHHKSAQADLEPLLAEGVLKGEFDMLRSGAMMAWQFCFPPGVTLPFGLDPTTRPATCRGWSATSRTATSGPGRKTAPRRSPAG